MSECDGCYGYCCTIYNRIYLTTLDISRIAKHFGMTKEEFAERYTKKCKPVGHTGKPMETRERITRCFKFSRPCIFWTHGLCGIYEVRPHGCAEWASEKIMKEYGMTCQEYHKHFFGRLSTP